MLDVDLFSSRDCPVKYTKSRIYLFAVMAAVMAGLAAAATLAMASYGTDTHKSQGPDGQSNPTWVRQFGTANTDGAEGIGQDAEGNLYVVGYTWSVGADSGGSAAYDAVVTKFDADGHEIWTTKFGTPDSDYAWNVAVSKEDGLYVLGHTRGALPGQTHLGSEDVYLRKFDYDGNALWTRQFGTEFRDEASDVEVDNQGNVYVAGITRVALPGQSKIGNEDVYIRKYDSGGNELWTRQFGTTGTDQITNIALDGSGHIYVVGPTSGEFPGQTQSGKYDAFLSQFDVDGNAIWTQQFGTAYTDSAIDVAADGEGRIYAVGFVRIATRGQRVGVVQNSLMHRFDGDGNGVWSREFGTINEDLATNVAVDGAGDIYVAGRTDGAFPGQVNFGGEDVYVRKFGRDGQEIWTYQFGSNANDNVRDIMLDGAGNLYLVGLTKGALAGQEHLGLSDAFLIKLSTGFSPPPAQNVIATEAGSCSGLVTQIKGRLSIGWILMGLMLPALTLAKLISRGSQG